MKEVCTTFEWEVTPPSTTEISVDSTMTIEVSVTNTGSVAGKDVVQVYVTTPYYEGGIEKSYKSLVGYAKTELLEPGETGVVSIEVDPYYFASYDYSDANGNGFCGYELEQGEYLLHVATNAHDTVYEISC